MAKNILNSQDSKSDDKEYLFKVCKESMEDVVGWKVFIFLHQNFLWRYFLMTSILFSYTIVIIQFFYTYTDNSFTIISLSCDLIYLLDTLCATLHYAMKKTRKLRHGKPRSIGLLFLDYISLAPVSLIYNYIYFESLKLIRVITYYLRLNVLLRLYQIHSCFYDSKLWIYKAKIYFLVSLLEMLTYLYLMTHFFSCFWYLSLSESLQQECQDDLKICLLKNELLSFCLVAQRHLFPPMIFDLNTFKTLIIIGFTIGYIFTYAYLLPNIMFMSLKFLRKFFQFSVRCKQLHLLTENFVDNKVLREKILSSFISLWMYGKGDRHPKVLNTFPLCFRKNLFCDMHWDAFRHSEIYRDLSLGCKRSLALHMRTEFVNAKTILLEKSEINEDFLYLESGVLQITAEENIKSPVISFSAGTVLGEISLFLKSPSKSVLQTAKFSVIHFLNFKDILKILLQYPKDSRIVQKRIIYRLNIGKATQTRKMKIAPQFLQNDNQKSSTKVGQPNIKWVKEQYRALMEMHKGMNNMIQNQQYITYSFIRPYIEKLGTQLEHTTVNIPLVCVNDEVISKFDAVCIRMSFPWVVDPQSNFLGLWNAIVCFMAFVSAIVYPYVLAWYEILPKEFEDLAVTTSFIYVIDILIKFFVAVKKKNMIITKFWVIARNRIEAFAFYIDLMAAFPLHLTVKIRGRTSLAILNLCFANALFKTYKIFNFLNKWNYQVSPNIITRTLLKWIFISLLLTYWAASLLHLSGVNCVFYECVHGDWLELFVLHQGKNSTELAAFFLAIFLSYDIPSQLLDSDIFGGFLIFFILTVFFRALFFLWLAECVGVFVLEYTHEVQYRNLTKFIYNFMQSRKIVGRIKKRVMDTMRFQWIFDYGDYITQDNRIIDDIQTKLKEEIDYTSVLPAISTSPFLQAETLRMQIKLLRKGYVLALPVDSVLVKFGTQSLKIFFIFKGFVQINSFLPKDLVQNVSTNFVLKQGQVFPVIMTLNQMPAAISIRTITDCIFVVLDLEDILTAFIVNDMLKDVVDALKSTDFSAMERAKLGLSRVNTGKVKRESKRKHLKKGALLKYLISRILLKKGINSRSKGYLIYEFIRVGVIVLNCYLWPFVMGVSLGRPSKTFLTFLLLIESLALPDFYVRLHLVYYNKNGVKLSHPLATSLHYLRSSFILDLLAFYPFFQTLYVLVDSQRHMQMMWLIILCCMRCLSLYRYFGVIRYLEEVHQFHCLIEFLKIIIPLALALNLYTNAVVFSSIVYNTNPLFYYNSRGYLYDTPWIMYLDVLSTCMYLLLRSQYFFDEVKPTQIVLMIVFSLVGTLLQIHLFSYLILRSTSTNLNFTTYQYYLKSFLNYLTSERAEDVYTNKAIEHFEHVWEKEKGEDLHKIFSRFPDILHEDLMYPIYRVTLKGVRCLSEANEAFHRLLSRYLCEIHLKKGTEIIFPNQIEGNIYFVHKGQCLVEKYYTTLYKGSLIGDLRRGRVMKNLIVADTHVVLLKISSDLFFLTMTNFQRTKSSFMVEANEVEDFIESIYYEKEETKKLTTLNVVPEQDLQDSEFEVVDDNAKVEENEPEEEKDDTHSDDEEEGKSKSKKKAKKSRVLNPTAKYFHYLHFFYLITAIATVIVVPHIISLHVLTLTTCVFVYCLDFVWIIKILITFRTAYLDPKTGNLLTSARVIFKHYFYKGDGFLLDILTVIPFEVLMYLYFMTYNNVKKCNQAQWGLTLRLLRFSYVLTMIKKEKKKLSMNFYLRWMTIIGSKFLKLNFFAATCALVFYNNKDIKDLMSPDECWFFSPGKMYIVVWSFVCVTNNYVEAGLPICLAETKVQALYHVALGIWAVFCKASVVNEVLTILYVTDHIKTDQMHELEQLERYLMVRDVSPSLFQKMRNYFCDLMHTYKEAAMPSFLVATPLSIKIDIMNDLYSSHLTDCYLFQNIDDNFLKQLAARLERNIFFPGDYVVHQGDVDQNMYFVHDGEVYCIENHHTYTALEIIVDLFVKGESFGILQGILCKYPHKYTYRAKTLADVLVLNYDKWSDLRQAFPRQTEAIYSKVLGAFSKLTDLPSKFQHY